MSDDIDIHQALQQELVKLKQLSDNKYLRLPHPARMGVVRYRDEFAMALGDRALQAIDKEVNQPGTANIEAIAHTTHIPALIDFYRMSPTSADGFNNGYAMLPFTYFRHLALHAPVFQISTLVDDALLNANFGTDITCDLLRAPFPTCYFEFRDERTSPLWVTNITTGQHVLEGVYVNEANISLKMFEGVPSWEQLVSRLGLNFSQQARMLEFLFTGAPKNRIANDSFLVGSLILPATDMPLEDVFAAHRPHWTAEVEHSDLRPLTHDEIHELESLIVHTAKAMLFVTTPSSVRDEVLEATQLKKQLRHLGARKASKLSRKLARSYDRIRIRFTQDVETSLQNQNQTGTRKAHIRRWHYQKYWTGEGRTTPVVRFKAMQTINPQNVDPNNPPTAKNYTV